MGAIIQWTPSRPPLRTAARRPSWHNSRPDLLTSWKPATEKMIVMGATAGMDPAVLSSLPPQSGSGVGCAEAAGRTG
jgi:hypothetical protein